MSDGHSQSALREWRRQMQHPLTLVTLCGVGVILGLAGPFGTLDLLTFPARIAYWLVMVTATYATGALISDVLGPRLYDRHKAVRIFVQGLLSGIGIALVVLGVNAAVFGWLPSSRKLPAFLGTLLVITLIVTAVLTLAHEHLAGLAASKDVAALPHAPLLDRVPFEKRGALIALSVEDHYTRVRTSKGEELILMRLSDAIRETGPTLGAQVHRSHWAAFDQVAAVKRTGDRAILTMSCGTKIPVSRANIPLLKEAGLLPR